MDCKSFREALDCYVDGELSAEATAAADTHRRECARCDRATARLLGLRSEVKRVVTLHAPPPLLERRVRTALRPRWMGRWATVRPVQPRHVAAAAVVVLGLVALSIAAGDRRHARQAAAAALDRIAVRLDESSTAAIQGTLLCRDCELEHRYGLKASCKVIGHHGAIATADGRIWNIVEQPSSAHLIHDAALLGQNVRVHARVYRRAGAIEIDSYQLDGRSSEHAERVTEPARDITASRIVARVEAIR